MLIERENHAWGYSINIWTRFWIHYRSIVRRRASTFILKNTTQSQLNNTYFYNTIGTIGRGKKWWLLYSNLAVYAKVWLAWCLMFSSFFLGHRKRDHVRMKQMMRTNSNMQGCGNVSWAADNFIWSPREFLSRYNFQILDDILRGRGKFESSDTHHSD